MLKARFDDGGTFEKLKRLKASTQKKIGRKALRAGAAPMVKAGKKNVPKRSGLMKRAIGQKVITLKKEPRMFALVGANAKVSGYLFRNEKNKWKFEKSEKREGEKRTFYRPSKILHIVERGSKFARPSKFLERSYKQTYGKSQMAIKTKLRDEIKQEVRKLRMQKVKSWFR